jgi:hypothetical protein
MIGKTLAPLHEGGMGRVCCAGCSVLPCLPWFKVPHHEFTISVEHLDRLKCQARLSLGKGSRRG